jgi:hypothetical protein
MRNRFALLVILVLTLSIVSSFIPGSYTGATEPATATAVQKEFGNQPHPVEASSPEPAIAETVQPPATHTPVVAKQNTPSPNFFRHPLGT